MFSPGTKRLNANPRHDPGSPATPLSEIRRAPPENFVPNRPSTGTPSPGPHASPSSPGDASVSGGMERGTSLAWIICGSRLFVWSFLSPASSANCTVLEIPGSIFEGGRSGGNAWLLRVVSWFDMSMRTKTVVKQCGSAGIVLCNKKTRAAVYWPDIYGQGRTDPVFRVASSDGLEVVSSPVDRKTPQRRQQLISRHRSSMLGSCTFNSLIACAVPDSQNECLAVACSSNGELWQFHCSPYGVSRKKVYQVNQTSSSQGGDSGSKGYPRSLSWCFPNLHEQESSRQYVFLTDHEMECFSMELSADFVVSKLWSHEIIGSDADRGIKKDLAGQKQIWPLDMQVDYHGKVTTILVATFCLDRGTSSSYTQYSLLTMQCKSGGSLAST